MTYATASSGTDNYIFVTSEIDCPGERKKGRKPEDLGEEHGD